MVRNFALFLLCIILMGCDPLYPPKFRNEYPGQINILIFSKDGTRASFFLQSCVAVFVGPIAPKPKHVAPGISKVAVEWRGEIIHEFSEEDLKIFLEKQTSHGGFSVWIIGPSGVHLSEERTCSLEKKKD